MTTDSNGRPPLRTRQTAPVAPSAWSGAVKAEPGCRWGLPHIRTGSSFQEATVYIACPNPPKKSISGR